MLTSVLSEGDCPPCELTSMHPCECGSSVMMLPCTQHQWHCRNTCGKLLSCGHHRCEKVCLFYFSSILRRMPILNILTAMPCGRLRCVPILWTAHVSMRVYHGNATLHSRCPDMQGPMRQGSQQTFALRRKCSAVLQLLSCGKPGHICVRTCHRGSCGACMMSTTLRCGCGSAAKEGLCGSTFVCDKRCNNTRNCERHQCRRRCCRGDCPPCTELCNRPLNCRCYS